MCTILIGIQRWTRAGVATELGAVLNARDAAGCIGPARAPREHRLFSELRFVRGQGEAEEAGERDAGAEEGAGAEVEGAGRWRMEDILNADEVLGLVLEDDDVEEW